jgi:hypothetical protein
MRHPWSSFILLVALAASANAQITRIATFENYAPGAAFQPSFTDALSGITFSRSTNPPLPGGFAINGDPLNLFDGTNYLTAGGGPNDGLGANFGFSGALPEPADQVSADVFVQGSAGVTLNGFDSMGVLVAQESGPPSTSRFNIEISSSQYNITSFQLSVVDRGTGYDNITYTILPEPTPISCLLLAISFPLLHRRRIPAFETPSNQLES